MSSGMGIPIHRRGRSSRKTTPRRSRHGRIQRLREDPGSRVLEVRHILLGGPDRGVFGAFRLSLLLEPTLAVDGGPAAVAGGRYSLAVAGVRDIAGGEHAGDARHGVFLLDYVAALFHL